MPDAGYGLAFVDSTSQITSFIINALGISIISFCLGRRTPRGNFRILRSFLSLSWTRLTVLAIFADSWIFLFSAGLLTSGIGLGASSSTCAAAIFLCIIFYVSSKLFIYLFLAERVYVVWSDGSSVSRRHCAAYKICISLIALYLGILGLMFAGHIADYSPVTGKCVIGLKKYASLPLLSYDLFVNVVTTSLFVIPVFRDKLIQKDLRYIAIRTLLGAGISLTTSTLNILILAILHGRELGWICLACCSADVAVNALAIFWVTSSVPDSRSGAIRTNQVSFTPLHLSISDPDPAMIQGDSSDAENEGMKLKDPSPSARSAMLPYAEAKQKSDVEKGTQTSVDDPQPNVAWPSTPTVCAVPPTSFTRPGSEETNRRPALALLDDFSRGLRHFASDDSGLLPRYTPTNSWPSLPPRATRISYISNGSNSDPMLFTQKSHIRPP